MARRTVGVHRPLKLTEVYQLFIDDIPLTAKEAQKLLAALLDNNAKHRRKETPPYCLEETFFKGEAHDH